MAGAVGYFLTAFSRRYKTESAEPSYFVDIMFTQGTITMGGMMNSPQFMNLSLGNHHTVEDITGDNATNTNMFVGNTNEPNGTIDFGSSASGIRYSYSDLPSAATERTYRITWGPCISCPPSATLPNGTTKIVTLMVQGKSQFQDASVNLMAAADVPGEVAQCVSPLAVREFIAGLGPSGYGDVWRIKEMNFIGLAITEGGRPGVASVNLDCSLVMDASEYAGSNNDIPDLTFYTKENIDQKDTFNDFKFRPDADVDYSSGATHTYNVGCGNTPKVSWDSRWMREELINQGVSGVSDDSQWLSYWKSPIGYVPDTHISVIIGPEFLGKRGTVSALSYTNNAAYANILAEYQKTATYDFTASGVPSGNGFAFTTWPDDNINPCENSTLSYNLISQTHESVSGANDGELEIVGTGGFNPYTYEWTDSGGLSVGNTALITGLAPDTYNCKIEDIFGCTVSASFTIDPGPPPCQGNVTINQQAGDGCGMVDLNPVVSNLANGVTTYNWIWLDPNGTTLSSGTQAQGATQDVNSATSPGLYTFQIDLGNNCIQSGTTAVTAANTPILNVTYTDVTTNGGSDGTATATVTGGMTPYTYLWSNGATTAAITGLTAGTYTIIVTDSRGCNVSKTISISEPAVLPPNVSPLDVCMNLSTNKFTFTDNNNYVGSNNILPYKIAITVKLVNNSSVIYTGVLSSPDIFVDNDLASLRTYNNTIKYGTNTDITILSGATLYNDVYQITFDWNFSGGTTVEATETILLNGLSITTFNALSITSSMTYDCNDDIINSLDTTNYSINNLPYTFDRTHSLSPPSGSSLSSPVLSSSSSALNYTGLELGVWTNSLSSDITWDMPGTINHQEYCIINNLTHTSSLNVLCYADPCVVTECIEKVRAKLDRAECNCDENDIKKYRYILKRVGHLLAMFDITSTCSNIIPDYTLLYDIIDITDCGCGCECGGCD